MPNHTTLRTSANDPLRVDFLSAAATGLPGRIGLTIAPGKRDHGRGWDRELAGDLARLRDEYDAALLVSLMEAWEYELLAIPDLLARATAVGIATRWFPIRDVDAPAAGEMPAFRALVEDIVAAARAGQTVVIHCRGGKGRSGLVAAACLVSLGHRPAQAIARVRAARPGAVEVSAQEDWVRAFATEVAGRPPVAPVSAPARGPAPPVAAARPVEAAIMRGCLLGGALGDALGNPIEFHASADIVRRHGAGVPASLTYAGGEVGEITDDTQMTLFTGEGLVVAGPAALAGDRDATTAAVRGALLRWYRTQTGSRGGARGAGWLLGERRLHVRRAPGNTCMSALAALARSPGRPHTVEQPANDSKGCGAVMRSAPFGLVAPARELAFLLARDAGALTHGHPSGHLSGAYLAALVWDLARGGELAEAMAAADALLVREPGHQELLAAVGRARELAGQGAPGVDEVESLGGGWVGEEALAIALCCALTCDRRSPDGVARALWRSVLHSGDSDSTGSITGNLLGTMVGEAGLPPAWLARLELGDVVAQLADDLHGVSRGVAADARRYRTAAAVSA